MKKTFILATAVLSFPMFDYVASSAGHSISDSANAFVARRSAIVARGPGGGVVAARRTVVGRPYSYYLSQSPTAAESSSANDATSERSNTSVQKVDERN